MEASLLAPAKSIYYTHLKIIWRDFYKISFESFQRYTKKALEVQILNEVALRQVVRKRDSFYDRKNDNTPKFPGNEIWY